VTVEFLREGELLVVGERLIAEDEHGVFVHPGSDLGERLAVVNLAKIDRAHLGDEMLVKPSECQSHGHTCLLKLARTPWARTPHAFAQQGFRTPRSRSPAATSLG
jgi:hypothetical protein